MSVSINEVKPGLTVVLDGQLFRCLEYHHQRAAQQSWIKIKFKNMRTGAIIEKTFKPGEKVEAAHIDYKQMQYLYADQDFVHFMEQTTFEQVAIPAKKVEDAIKYLREGFVATIAFYDDEVLDVNLPTAVELKVTETSPGFKGDTVSGGKPATMETGLVVQVPFFVNEGDLLKVDTRDGKYCGRV
ncbi:elongation factor P [candidate division WOR-1 bacterium RIFOXYB2_FULL_42_35]|uniref:Elongation factor P n=1 Tax=candidate division WOR-1 bacterium RIFOXYC2_FULL_41_25 TaxID=1802586 RepID=A0A1F4TQA7_UNCSA|nr:MAG: elongation factor P [candidate division WOR-1 bacterium RIFOXYA2_FULL_41_14]OGC25203.1 MAG: elongation factor P [candidate division WOR-1 bacterium RIFOXYB2_FULL_42_35]OGC34759.1 MAG: elongation factor P [candidate division WOR-1 bacterium RIFOXYC2_FULL_41_25]